MEPRDDLDFDHFSGKLTEKLDVIAKRTGAVEAHLRGQDGRNEADFADRVAYTENDDVLEALDDAGRAEMDAIQHALQRIVSGAYGQCVGCGEDIAAGRLEVMPEAALCLACASKEG